MGARRLALSRVNEHLCCGYKSFDVFPGNGDIFDLAVAILRRFRRGHRDQAAILHDHAGEMN